MGITDRTYSFDWKTFEGFSCVTLWQLPVEISRAGISKTADHIEEQA
jgi:hypothetical protein